MAVTAKDEREIIEPSSATDNNNNNNGDQVKKSLHKGIKECCEFIDGTNGAILNGTLQWMSIKRSMLPDENGNELKKVYGEFVVTPFRERILNSNWIIS